MARDAIPVKWVCDLSTIPKPPWGERVCFSNRTIPTDMLIY